jgi:hypothetical protein
MPFALTNPPTTFESVMKVVLERTRGEIFFSFLYDINSHVQPSVGGHEDQLFAKLLKCTFAHTML